MSFPILLIFMFCSLFATVPRSLPRGSLKCMSVCVSLSYSYTFKCMQPTYLLKDTSFLPHLLFSRLHRRYKNFWPGSETWKVTPRTQRRADPLFSHGKEAPKRSLFQAPSTTGQTKSHSTKGNFPYKISEFVYVYFFVKYITSCIISPNVSHSNFVAIVDLPEGEHQYKFCVDGNWTLDPTGVSSFPSV